MPGERFIPGQASSGSNVPVERVEPTHQESSLVRELIAIYSVDLLKGCSSFTQQLDTGTGRVQDICMTDEQECRFYDGQYQTQGRTEPLGKVSQYDCNIAEGVQVGFCRLQKDAIRVGPAVLFDKRWVRPTPTE